MFLNYVFYFILLSWLLADGNESALGSISAKYAQEYVYRKCVGQFCILRKVGGQPHFKNCSGVRVLGFYECQWEFTCLKPWQAELYRNKSIPEVISPKSTDFSRMQILVQNRLRTDIFFSWIGRAGKNWSCKIWIANKPVHEHCMGRKITFSDPPPPRESSCTSSCVFSDVPISSPCCEFKRGKENACNLFVKRDAAISMFSEQGV